MFGGSSHASGFNASMMVIEVLRSQVSKLERVTTLVFFSLVLPSRHESLVRAEHLLCMLVILEHAYVSHQLMRGLDNASGLRHSFEISPEIV